MKIIQRLIYPDNTYTTRISLRDDEYVCHTSPVVETHFWVDNGKLNSESLCKCGKERLGNERLF
jgi:hypothetical protein